MVFYFSEEEDEEYLMFPLAQPSHQIDPNVPMANASPSEVWDEINFDPRPPGQDTRMDPSCLVSVIFQHHEFVHEPCQLPSPDITTAPFEVHWESSMQQSPFEGTDAMTSEHFDAHNPALADFPPQQELEAPPDHHIGLHDGGLQCQLCFSLEASQKAAQEPSKTMTDQSQPMGELSCLNQGILRSPISFRRDLRLELPCDPSDHDDDIRQRSTSPETQQSSEADDEQMLDPTSAYSLNVGLPSSTAFQPRSKNEERFSNVHQLLTPCTALTTGVPRAHQLLQYPVGPDNTIDPVFLVSKDRLIDFYDWDPVTASYQESARVRRRMAWENQQSRLERQDYPASMKEGIGHNASAQQHEEADQNPLVCQFFDQQCNMPAPEEMFHEINVGLDEPRDMPCAFHTAPNEAIVGQPRESGELKDFEEPRDFGEPKDLGDQQAIGERRDFETQQELGTRPEFGDLAMGHDGVMLAQDMYGNHAMVGDGRIFAGDEVSANTPMRENSGDDVYDEGE